MMRTEQRLELALIDLGRRLCLQVDVDSTPFNGYSTTDYYYFRQPDRFSAIATVVVTINRGIYYLSVRGDDGLDIIDLRNHKLDPSGSSYNPKEIGYWHATELDRPLATLRTELTKIVEAHYQA